MNRFFKTFLLAVAFTTGIFTAFAAQPAPKHEGFDTDRLSRRVIAPREIVDLQGEWQTAHTTSKEVRKEPFTMLNGKTYERKIYEAAPLDAETVWLPARIPFWEGLDPRFCLWAKRSFTLPALNGRMVLVRFEAMEDAFVVTVNGKDFTQTDAPGYCLEWVRDITDAVKEGENEILVSFPNVDFPTCKFLSRRGGAVEHWGATRGIRGPAQIEIVSPVYIEDVFVKTFVEKGKRIEVECGVKSGISNSTATEKYFIEATCGSLKLRGDVINGKAVLKGEWPEAKLWTPDEPNLYNLEVRLYQGSGSSSDTTTGALTRTTATPHSALLTPHCIDAVRQRFGFREFSMKGNRFYLNGIPFMARAGWVLKGEGYDGLVAGMKQFKKRGFNAMRTFVGQGSKVAEIDAADEVGILSMIGGCTENGGGGYDTRVSNDGRYDEDFWRHYDEFNEKFVRNFRNHPGVIVWSLGCEFGAIYCGQGTGREKVTGERICAAAEKVMKLDPTRTWTENGGVEVGYPAKGRGPCPTRSFHYPVPLNTDGAAMPDVAYWYADGVVPWQKVGGFDKPALITEDCYHGMQDSFRSMSRYANDDVYTDEGYYAALRKGFNLFAEGYYAGGLAWWEPWMPFADRPDNKLFDDYEAPSAKNGFKVTYREPAWKCIPEWMIAMRPFFANMAGGESDVRTLYLYNQTFTPRDVVLTRIETLDGKEIACTNETIRLEPGVKFERKITLYLPKVEKVAKYEVEFRIEAEGGRLEPISSETTTGAPPRTPNSQPSTLNIERRTSNVELASRKYSFTVFPKELTLGNLPNYAAVAETNSPVCAFAKSFGCGVYTNVTEAVAKNPSCLVVAKALDARGGKAVDDFVQAGGRALLIDVKAGDWSPIDPLFDKTVRNTWRRRESSMKDFPNEAMSCWRPNDIVTTSVIPKNGVEDSCVVQDCALVDGLSAALTTWLFRGKGAYLLSQAPVFDRWSDEPAAKYYFAALLGEMDVRGRPAVSKKVGLWSCSGTNSYTVIDKDCARREYLQWRHVTTQGPSYETIFKQSGIITGEFTNVLDEADVIFMDGSCGITDEMMAAIDRATARRGVKVVISELPEDTNRGFLFKFGCQLLPTREWYRDEKGEFLPDRHPHPMGEFPFWTVPSRSGVFAGLTADDFLWYKENLVSDIMNDRMTGNPYRRIRIKHDDSLMTSKIRVFDGLRDAKALCEPCAAAYLPYNQGAVIVSTLRFRTFFGRHERQIRYILRTLLNNLGCSTSVAEKVYEQEPLDIHGAFNRNLWRDPVCKQADGTFSPEAWFGDDNDFRYFPVNLCGWSTAANNFCPKGVFPKQPMLLAGKRFIVQDPEKNGGKAVLFLNRGESATIKLDHPVKADRFRLLGTAANFGKNSELKVTINGVEQSFNGDDHFGARWWAAPRPQGAVAWAGETPKDPNGGLYSWLCVNPDADSFVSEITFKAETGSGGFALLAITAEREAE